MDITKSSLSVSLPPSPRSSLQWSSLKSVRSVPEWKKERKKALNLCGLRFGSMAIFDFKRRHFLKRGLYFVTCGLYYTYSCKSVFVQFLLYVFFSHLTFFKESFTYESFISIDGARTEYAEDWETEGWQLHAELMSVRRCHQHSRNSARYTLWEFITQAS